MRRYRFPLPIESGRELRTQLTEHVLGRCLDGLEAAGRSRRQALRSGALERHADMVRTHVRRAYGPMPFGKSGGPLDTRLVSRHDTRHCRVENVLFDSFPGWQVNASLFVPQGKGPFPAVVIPVGHSGKQFDNYQIPAQAYASLGFVAVLFDPPGQASERQIGNDHFHDGVRCHLTGLSSNRYFVLDALRCIDYLETRPDVDLSRGVGMTGVSGGGFTTVCATLFDGRFDVGGSQSPGRIACQGPSCCLTKLADHPVGDGYSSCPETLWWNRIGEGVDEVDLVLAGAPVPTIYMAGVDDEVFHIEWSRDLASVIAEGFGAAGLADRFAFFEDSCGHAYSLRQVEAFAAWMNRWMLGQPADGAGVSRLERGDFAMLDYEMLRCHPSQAVTMYSLNRGVARAQREERSPRPALVEARGAVRRLTTPSDAAHRRVGAASWVESDPVLLWAQEYREALCTFDGLEMPASLIVPPSPRRAARWMLFLDESGRCSALEGGGVAAQLARLFARDQETPLPGMAVADLPGWGESAPGLVPFALPGWGSRDRLLAYHSVTLGDGILALQTRAAVSLIDAFGERAKQGGGSGTDLAVIGRGLGGVVALLAGVLSERVRWVVAWSSLAAFQLLVESERYAWPASAFLPNTLREIDLPEVAASLAGAGRDVLVLDPLDAERRSLGRAEAAELYGQGAGGPDVLAAPSAEQAIGRIESLLYGR